MTKQELAKFLDGRKYGNEITRDMAETAKSYGLVVVFGYSDDNMEFRGAINDEIGCYDGGVVHLDKDGIFAPWEWCDCYDGDRPCKLIQKIREKCLTVEAVWRAPDSPAWTYKTLIPHEIFNIMEDDEVYCRGIVFCVDDLK